MTSATATPRTLLDLLEPIPAQQTAVVVPERNIRITYRDLRGQVEALANQLAAVGVGRGDRVGIALANGLPTIVSFLAASVAGTAAPLNPGYKEDEFRFYLEDTGAGVLILPPQGAEEARCAAGDRVRILTVDMDSTGAVKLGSTDSPTARHRTAAPPAIDDVALILHTSGSTGRPKRVPLTHANICASASVATIRRSRSGKGDDTSHFHTSAICGNHFITFAD